MANGLRRRRPYQKPDTAQEAQPVGRQPADARLPQFNFGFRVQYPPAFVQKLKLKDDYELSLVSSYPGVKSIPDTTKLFRQVNLPQ